MSLHPLKKHRKIYFVSRNLPHKIIGGKIVVTTLILPSFDILPDDSVLTEGSSPAPVLPVPRTACVRTAALIVSSNASNILRRAPAFFYGLYTCYLRSYFVKQNSRSKQVCSSLSSVISPIRPSRPDSGKKYPPGMPCRSGDITVSRMAASCGKRFPRRSHRYHLHHTFSVPPSARPLNGQ